ncbi:MAG: efflux RND transporter periplasmic adaptor subunit [Polyangiaceae bacterium]|nr:efflux RND transporter periplasmic adaptor subunit [Polyangiaceae bacterium]
MFEERPYLRFPFVRPFVGKAAFELLLLSSLVVPYGCHHKTESATPGGPANEAVLSQEQIAKINLKTAVVDLQDIDNRVLTTGKVTYEDQKVAHVFSPVAGKAVKVLVKLGDHVKKGDPLVVIDSPDIGVATSDAGKAKADLIAAAHEFQRQKELLATHATSQKDYESAANDYRKAKAELERAEQKARLFRQGDITGQSFTLRADIEGEVFMRAVSPGMELAGQYSGGNPPEIFTIGQTDRVWVIADVFELDVRRVKLDAKVEVEVVSWPGRSFVGKVDWISSALDPNTHATKVRCSFDNSDDALKPEMFATVKISVDARRALAIPRSSVLRLGDQTVVFFDRGAQGDKRRFERLPVTVDEGEGGEFLTVGHGVEKGDVIVTNGAILLSGML